MKATALTFLGAVLGFAVLSSGCVLSIDPIVPEFDARLDPRLLGTWKTSESEFAIVSHLHGNVYAIEYTSGKDTGTLEARLGRLGEHTVLDVWPAAPDGRIPQPYAGLLVEGHFVLNLEFGSDEIRTTVINPDSIIRAIEAGDVRLSFRESKHQVVLFGNTETLRSGLESYLSRRGALNDTTVWRRAATPIVKEEPLALGDTCFQAAAWPEADQLFHRDPHWLGADGASTVDLGDGRILWLFGDTWIDASGQGTRKGAEMVSNTLAIQRGTDPRTAAINFYWGESDAGLHQAYFPNRDSESLWPGSGVRVGDRLVLFLLRIIRGTGAGLGFASQGWTAVMVENPDADPSAWRWHQLETPANPLGALIGFAAAFEQAGYAYALGSQDPVKSHPVFVARWPMADVSEGNLVEPEWWGGERHGWVPDSSSTPRWPLFENGASELSIHRDPTSGQFVIVQTRGFGAAELIIRTAQRLTGPWSAGRTVYHPPEYERPNVMIYAAKAHPQLTGADLVVTYATNTFSPAEHLTDSRIYYPRFVRLMRCTTQ